MDVLKKLIREMENQVIAHEHSIRAAKDEQLVAEGRMLATLYVIDRLKTELQDWEAGRP